MEKKTVRKWMWAWNFDKEEEWLNQQAQNGWVLDGLGFCTYHFVKCEPDEYTVRMEMKPMKELGSNCDDYIRFLEETGAEYIGRMVQWIYFRKKTELGTFDLFSDLDSRIAHLDKIAKMMLIILFANLVIGLVNSFNFVNMGWLNLLCAALLAYATGRIHGKKESLEKERLLRE